MHYFIQPHRLLWLLTISLLFSCNLKERSKTEVKSPLPQYEWKMATSWPPNFPILGEGAQQIATLIEEMSQGQLKVRVYGAGELIPPLGVFDAVSQGSIQMGHTAAYYYQGKIPEIVFFTTIPFGLQGTDMTTWLLSDEVEKMWRDLYEPFNLVPFYAGNSDTQMAGWFRNEIKSLSDLEGLKMRVPGLGGKIMARVGVSTMNVAGGEIYTNLERGVIDAAEWVGPSHDLMMGFDKVAKYYYYPGWHEPGSSFELIVNKEALQSLPPHLQRVIEVASKASGVWVHAEFERTNAQGLAKMRKTSDVKIVPLPPPVMHKLKTEAEAVIGDFIQTSPQAEKIYRSAKQMQTKLENWQKLKK